MKNLVRFLKFNLAYLNVFLYKLCSIEKIIFCFSVISLILYIKFQLGFMILCEEDLGKLIEIIKRVKDVINDTILYVSSNSNDLSSNNNDILGNSSNVSGNNILDNTNGSAGNANGSTSNTNGSTSNTNGTSGNTSNAPNNTNDATTPNIQVILPDVMTFEEILNISELAGSLELGIAIITSGGIINGVTYIPNRLINVEDEGNNNDDTINDNNDDTINDDTINNSNNNNNFSSANSIIEEGDNVDNIINYIYFNLFVFVCILVLIILLIYMYKKYSYIILIYLIKFNNNFVYIISSLLKYIGVISMYQYFKSSDNNVIELLYKFLLNNYILLSLYICLYINYNIIRNKWELGYDKKIKNKIFYFYKKFIHLKVKQIKL
jgi:hypothetical protein